MNISTEKETNYLKDDEEEQQIDAENEFNGLDSFIKKKSLKIVLILIIFILFISFILTILVSNIILMKLKYDNINDNYLNSFVMTQANQNFKNFTETLSLQIKILNNVMLQSRMFNTETSILLAIQGICYFLVDNFTIPNSTTLLSNITINSQTNSPDLYKTIGWFFGYLSNLNTLFPLYLEEMIILNLDDYSSVDINPNITSNMSISI